MNRRNLLRTLVPLLFVLAALDVNAQQPARDADLGTPAEAFERFDADYRRAVEAAVPRFDGERLAERLRTLHARHPRGVPGITATDALTLARQLDERVPDLRPRQAGFDDETLSLGVDARAGQAWFHRDLDAEPLLPPRNAERMAPSVARQHAALLTRLGVAADQRFFVHQAFTVRSSAEAPGEGAASREGRPQVDGIATLVLRSVDGIQVEGGIARLSSRQAGRLQDLELRWPQVRMHPMLRSFDIKQREVVLRDVLAGVERTASGAVNVRTAVVLRPVLVGNDTVHVPALRVGVLPDNGEAGDLFYVDLARESAPYRDSDGADEDQAGRDQESSIGLRGGPRAG
ncbi:MAG: hypothetical protein KF823_02550 [Xanthomonadales bacterium]|nr:hypothetical protein [Xanthomonadales bacterium]